MKQFFRFLTVGVFNTILGYSVIFASMYMGNLSPESSNAIGYSAGLVASYILNRNYTFKSKQSRRSEIIRFIAVFVFAYVLNFVALTALIYKFNTNAGVSQVLAGIVYIFASYCLNKYYVFKISSAG